MWGERPTLAPLMSDPRTIENDTLLRQIDEVTEIAQQAFERGDKVGGSAAIVLATQLLQLARIRERAR